MYDNFANNIIFYHKYCCSFLQVNSYKLTVRATDGQLSSETLVTVDVLDVNDCPPKFSEANYSAVIQVMKKSDFLCLL